MRHELGEKSTSRRVVERLMLGLVLVLFMPGGGRAGAPDAPDPNVGVFAGEGVNIELAGGAESAPGVRSYVGRIDIDGARTRLTAKAPKGYDKVQGLIGEGKDVVIFTLEVKGDEAELRLSGRTFALRRGAVVGAHSPPAESPKSPTPAAPPPPRPAQTPPHVEPHPQAPPSPGIPPVLIGTWLIGSGYVDWVDLKTGSSTPGGNMESYRFFPNGTFEHVSVTRAGYSTIALYEAGIFAVKGAHIQFKATKIDGFSQYGRKRQPHGRPKTTTWIKSWGITTYRGFQYLVLDGVNRLVRRG